MAAPQPLVAAVGFEPASAWSSMLASKVAGTGSMLASFGARGAARAQAASHGQRALAQRAVFCAPPHVQMRCCSPSGCAEGWLKKTFHHV